MLQNANNSKRTLEHRSALESHSVAGVSMGADHIKRKIWQDAHNAIHMELRKGNLIKQEICAYCDKRGPTHAHHPDYNKPYEIVWVCVPCHIIMHRFEAFVLNMQEETTKQINDDCNFLNRRLLNRNILSGRCRISRFFRP